MQGADKQGFIQMGGGKEYRQVANRLSDFRAVHPDYLIETSAKEVGERHYMFCRIMMPVESAMELRPISTGHKEIKFEGGKGASANFPLETAETGAIGRALAAAGFGTLDGVLDEGEQIADSPVAGATRKKKG